MRSNLKATLSILAALVLILLAVAAFSMSSPANVEAALAAAPTPVSAGVRSANPGQYYLFFSDQTVDEATQSTNCFELGDYTLADVYYDVDVTDAQTVTLYMQFGNTEANMVNGVAFASTVVTDTTNMQQVQLFGRYACAYVTVGTTNTVGITVDAWAK